jgi:hypothetical protein
MVLLIRGDLLQRYPRAIMYAVEGVWSADKTRRELGVTEQYPIFRATQAPDVTMLGFLLTEKQVRGADNAANGGHPDGSSFSRSNRPNRGSVWTSPPRMAARLSTGAICRGVIWRPTKTR